MISLPHVTGDSYSCTFANVATDMIPGDPFTNMD